jgi:prepilin-type N-terminal cleavage/methylation domain-containing protein
MLTKNFANRKGLTLPEVIVAAVILVIAVIGTLGIRYYSSLDARRAEVQNGAARLGSVFLEVWKGLGGPLDYDPKAELDSQFDISTTELGPAAPSGFEKLGSYHIDSDRINYYATLAYQEPTQLKPRTLNVTVAWMHKYQQWDGLEPVNSVKITTYVDF